MLDALHDGARLSAVNCTTRLVGTHDDTSREVASVAVGGGQDNVGMDETSCTPPIHPLDKVWVFSLGSLVSADDAIGLCPSRVDFRYVVDSNVLVDVKVFVLV
jgi:hypothetical protein